MAVWQAVANHQGEQVGADNSEDAADNRADQPLQADPPQPPFEQNDAQADRPHLRRIKIRAATEGLNEVASNSNNKNK